jgi:hypothetical protein
MQGLHTNIPGVSHVYLNTVGASNPITSATGLISDPPLR